MQCYSHTGAHAIGVCRNCGRGVCRACATETGRDIVCSTDCAQAVNAERDINKRAQTFWKASPDGRALVPASALIPGLFAIALLAYTLFDFLLSGHAGAPVAGVFIAVPFIAASIINWRKTRRLGIAC